MLFLILKQINDYGLLNNHTSLYYRPLLHAVYNVGVTSSFGIEMDETKVQKALAFIKRTIDEMGSPVSTPILYCIPIENVSF